MAACPGAFWIPSWDGESSAGRAQQKTAGCLFLLFLVVRILLNEEKLL